MTEVEKIIINKKEILLYRDIETGLYRFSKDAVEILLQAFEEIQQYRAMEQRLRNIYGECDGLLEVVVSGLERHEDIELPSCIFKSRLLTDEDVDMWDEYRAIGTVEELQALKEKNEPKKPILCMNEVSGMFVDYADGHGEYKTQMNNWWRCPCCNEVVGQRVVVHNRTHDQKKKKFCNNCGQKLDFGKEE